MPYSSQEGKGFALSHLDRVRPKSILDVGAGAGYWSQLITRRPWFGQTESLHAVEVWAPYVSQFGLQGKYNAVTLADARIWVPFLAEARLKYGAVILGDILEHMTKAEALELWAAVNRVADELVILSLPIVHYPQHAEDGGNPYEEHVKDDWTHEEVMDTFPGITDHYQGQEIGVYVARVW
jgi:hypothetical protein